MEEGYLWRHLPFTMIPIYHLMVCNIRKRNFRDDRCRSRRSLSIHAWVARPLRHSCSGWTASCRFRSKWCWARSSSRCIWACSSWLKLGTNWKTMTPRVAFPSHLRWKVPDGTREDISTHSDTCMSGNPVIWKHRCSRMRSSDIGWLRAYSISNCWSSIHCPASPYISLIFGEVFSYWIILLCCVKLQEARIAKWKLRPRGMWPVYVWRRGKRAQNPCSNWRSPRRSGYYCRLWR